MTRNTTSNERNLSKDASLPTSRGTMGLCVATFALFFTLTVPSAAAQTPAPKPTDQKPDVEAPKPQEDDKDLRELDPFGRTKSPTEEEMEELFLTVDKRLQRVTELLFEASSGDASGADQIGSAGIDELIRQAESASSSAQSDIAKLLEASRRQSEAATVEIDRILEIAAQNPQGGQGQGSPSQPPPPSSSGDPKQGQTPSGSKREEKGQQPGEQDQGQQPKEGEKPEGEDGKKPDEKGEKPQGNQEAEGGKDDKGKNPPQSELGSEAAPRGDENWGDLPIHLRKVFQNGVSDDVPPRYRDWVDSYYERLRRDGKSPR